MLKIYKKGFTLIELLVVVAIIGILASVILVALTSARNKGADTSIKSNLRSAISQGEVFYNTNTTDANSYISVCTNGPVGGVLGIGGLVLTAAQSAGLSSYGTNTTGTLTTATCNDSASDWAAEVPLKTSGQMWCVDNTGKSKLETSSIDAGTSCL